MFCDQPDERPRGSRSLRARIAPPRCARRNEGTRVLRRAVARSRVMAAPVAEHVRPSTRHEFRRGSARQPRPSTDRHRNARSDGDLRPLAEARRSGSVGYPNTRSFSGRGGRRKERTSSGRRSSGSNCSPIRRSAAAASSMTTAGALARTACRRVVYSPLLEARRQHHRSPVEGRAEQRPRTGGM